VAFNENELRDAVNFYLENPQADGEARRAFLEREVTFTDGSAGKRTGEYITSLVKQEKGHHRGTENTEYL